MLIAGRSSQDCTLLREPRRALQARIAETLESQFAETAESQPEILARHCTEAGLIEKAAGLWPSRDSGRRHARRWLKLWPSSPGPSQGMIAEELQATGVVRGEEHLQLQAAEQPRQYLHRQEIFGTAADPACAVE
jgi:hypothetical protein